MKIGAALVLIAVGAILRFALATVASHGLYLHTVGDILMGVGVLGLVLWFFMWGPLARGGRATYRRSAAVDTGRYPQDSYPPGSDPQSSYRREEVIYEDDYPN